jgi:hypothetical protein
MPTIRIRSTATSDDVLSNVKFSDIPAQGAIINGYFACGTAGDAMGLSLGNADIVVQGTRPNVEVRAGAIIVPDDQLVFAEIVSGGHLYLPITAVTTELLSMIQVRYLG